MGRRAIWGSRAGTAIGHPRCCFDHRCRTLRNHSDELLSLLFPRERESGSMYGNHRGGSGLLTKGRGVGNQEQYQSQIQLGKT